MQKAEFDSVADEYEAQHRANIAITGESPDYFAAYKVAAARDVAASRGVAVGRVLDFGSGIGNSIPHFRAAFPGAQLACIDASERSLALSRTRFPGNESYACVEGARIPAEDAAADIAFSACVFHHIPHEEHLAWLGELQRVTRPGGMLAIFEHNPLNPLTVRAVNTCPFDANARLIRAGVMADRVRASGWTAVQVRFHVFFPRALAALRPLEGMLRGLPLGAQYSVTALRP